MERVCLDEEQRRSPTRLIPIFDDAGGCYASVASGWEGARWAQDLMVFVRIKDEKIHIESDWTYEGIANFLIENGIPENEIVLCWLPAYLQPMIEHGNTVVIADV